MKKFALITPLAAALVLSATAPAADPPKHHEAMMACAKVWCPRIST